MKFGKMLVLALVLAFAGGVAYAADPAPAAAPAAAPAVAAAPAAPPAPEVFEVGKVAKDLKVKDAAGKDLDLLKMGKTNFKVITFMNTSCSACKQEVNFLSDMLKKNEGKFDLIVVASDMGTFDRVAKYQTSSRLGGEWVHDPDFAVPPRFGFSYAPCMVVVDKGGKVLFSKGGWTSGGSVATGDEIMGLIK